MEKYYSTLINLCLLLIENVIMTLLIYNNPTKENILNVSGSIIGILIACEITIILLVLKEKVNQENLK